MRFLFCCNTLHGFCNFRLDVVEHLIGKGNDAVIVYPHKDGDEATLKTLPAGCRAVECRMSPNGKSVFQDFGYFFRLLRVFRREKPDLVFNYTIKPNIYGGLAARLKSIPSVAMAPGLGYSFSRKGIFGYVLRKLYVMALGLAKAVFVLNSSDRDCLIKAGLDGKKIILLEGGEGINLKKFPYTEGEFFHPRFLMVSRLLYDKGYREFVSVAKRVKVIYPDVCFDIVGTINENNPAGVPKSVVEADVKSGSIRYLGYSEDIFRELSDPNTVVVLPSYYREGMNRSLMEACSCGRPVITTSLPGLRELVVEGENGYLVEPRDETSLYDKIKAFLDLPVERRVQMGRRSREIAETHFNVERVKSMYDKTIGRIITDSNV